MGFGKRKMTYMMLNVWYDFFPVLSIKALHTIVSGTGNIYSYGSWRDICELCAYLKNNTFFTLYIHPFELSSRAN